MVLLGKDKGEANEEGVFGGRSDVYVWFEDGGTDKKTPGGGA